MVYFVYAECHFHWHQTVFRFEDAASLLFICFRQCMHVSAQFSIFGQYNIFCVNKPVFVAYFTRNCLPSTLSNRERTIRLTLDFWNCLARHWVCPVFCFVRHWMFLVYVCLLFWLIPSLDIRVVLIPRRWTLPVLIRSSLKSLCCPLFVIWNCFSSHAVFRFLIRFVRHSFVFISFDLFFSNQLFVKLKKKDTNGDFV